MKSDDDARMKESGKEDDRSISHLTSGTTTQHKGSDDPNDPEYWIRSLQLEPHFEGGYFRRHYESHIKHRDDTLPNNRSVGTAIYYLLKGSEFSALHRLKSDELWHLYYGSPVKIYVFHGSVDGGEGNTVTKLKLGNPAIVSNASFVHTVRAGDWFGAKIDWKEWKRTTHEQDHNQGPFALMGCTVHPGFEMSEFEFGDRELLISQYPNHRKLILKLTRDSYPTLT